MNWYFMQGRERKGPVNLEGLRELLEDGTIDRNTLIWNKGLGDEWVKVADVPALAGPSAAAVDPKLQEEFDRKLVEREEQVLRERRSMLVKSACAGIVLLAVVAFAVSFVKGKARRALGISDTNPIIALEKLEPRLLNEYKMDKQDLKSFEFFKKPAAKIVQFTNAKADLGEHVSARGTFTFSLNAEGVVQGVVANFASPGLHGPNLNDRSIGSIVMEEMWAAHGGPEKRQMMNHDEVLPQLGSSCGYANVPKDAVCHIIEDGGARGIWSEYGPHTCYALVYWETR